jgi:Flp pilus assembly protein TadD
LLSDDPSLAIVRYNVALIHIHEQNFASARADLKLALVISPHYSRAQLALGYVLLRLGKVAEARVLFMQCLKDSHNQQIRESAQAVLAGMP